MHRARPTADPAARLVTLVTPLVVALAAPALADTPADGLPISEVTAFKDGHALVVRAGAAPLDARGDVVLYDMPRPILGAFWADEREEGARLASVMAERFEEDRAMPASTPAELLRANVGARIAFIDVRNELREGVLREIVTREPEAPDDAARPQGWNDWQWFQFQQGQGAAAPTTSIALIETEHGVASIPIEQIRDLRFLDGAPETSIITPRERERMTLDLAWEGAAPDAGDVSLMYVQRGLRWVPSYRVTVLDEQNIRLELQATLVNELADLDDVTVNFAVGVPSFAFADAPDPIAMRDALADLGPYFRPSSETGAMFSNAIMGQSARMSGYAPSSGGGDAPGAAPELTGSERAEDLYVYTIEHVTLRKGARMVVPLVAYDVCYETLYRLELPARPPYDASNSIPHERRTAVERALSSPIPTHVLRITNDNADDYPITTAPALVIKDGRTLAQGMLTYTAPGGVSDLDVGKGVEIGVETREIEGERDIKAVRWNNNDYARADVEFSATITNRKPDPVRLEVVKIAFGEGGDAGLDGEVETLSPYDALLVGGDEWAWWRGYNWPWWWGRFNTAVRISWDVTIEPGEAVELNASWGYYWR